MASDFFAGLLARVREHVALLRARVSEPTSVVPPALAATIVDLERLVADLDAAGASLRRAHDLSNDARVAAEQQRRYYEGLWKFAPAGYLITTFDGVIVEANHTAAALFGGSIAFLRGRNVGDYAATGERRAFDALRDAVAAGTHTEAREFRLLREDGTPWIGMVCAVGTRAAQAPPTIRWSFQDISESKRQESVRPSATRYRTLFEYSPDPLVLLDPHSSDVAWKIVDCNDVLCTLHGYSRDELIGKPASIFDAVEYDDIARHRFLELLRTDRRWQTTTWHKRKDASIFPIAVSTALVYLDDREYVLGVERDMTAVFEAEQALRRSEEFHRSLIENSSDIITVVDTDIVIRYKTPSLERLFGYAPTPNDTPVAGIINWVHPDDQALFRSTLERATQTSSMVGPIQFAVRNSDGSWRSIETIMHNMLDHPAVQGIVLNSHDVTEHKRMEDALTERTLHDALTGLPARALFLELLASAFEQRRRDPSRTFAVVLLDIDHLKSINDVDGHQVGDGVLVELARRLQSTVRPADTVARVGGDEFALLLAPVRDVDHVVQIVQRCYAALEHAVVVESRELRVHASSGIVVATSAHRGPEHLLRDADAALGRAKRFGRGMFAVFDARMDEPMRERLHLARATQRALDHDDMEVCYDVVRTVADDTISAFEARLCWEHPQHGRMTLDTLGPIAADAGLIAPLMRSIVRRALAHLVEWRRACGYEGALMLTMPAPFFALPDVVDAFAAATREHGALLEHVELCVDERALTATDSVKLAGLRDLGVGALTLDQWGVHTIAAGGLVSPPVVGVRLAADLVRDVPDDVNAALLLRTMTTIAANLGLAVTAAGVTSDAQRRFLREIGVARYQGPRDSAAVGADEVLRMLSE